MNVKPASNYLTASESGKIEATGMEMDGWDM